ncbi:hypothetical protein [Methylobrevis pamukkalensis]|uniref:hypothetical protein n=1 Tax=Methylobrevis pamukkalensis TaxID=1439726 RepID=UPI0008461232|nr:hypothetical protein [Methylobrevis pamukkalensis]
MATYLASAIELKREIVPEPDSDEAAMSQALPREVAALTAELGRPLAAWPSVVLPSEGREGIP